MSTILNELVKIREKLDSDGVYSGSTAGVPETVTQIRELVENGAGGGSGGGKMFYITLENGLEVINANYTDIVSAYENCEPVSFIFNPYDEGDYYFFMPVSFRSSEAMLIEFDDNGVATPKRFKLTDGRYVEDTAGPGR